MNESKVRALKLQVQAAATKAARAFYEVEREETGHGRCGGCEACQESLTNLSKLFFKAMEREVSVLYLDELERDAGMKHRASASPSPSADERPAAKDLLN